MRFNKSVMALAFVLAVTVFGGHSAYATDTKQTQDSGSDSQAQTTTNETISAVEVTVRAGDTLTEIAQANNTSVAAIAAQNNITDTNLIEPGQVIKVTQGESKLADKYDKIDAAVTAFLTPAATTTTESTTQTTAVATTTTATSTTSTSSSSYYVGNGMWCTDYVHSRRPDVPIYGNAGYNWISAAQADGKATGTVARAGAVAVMSGHVAYVESVNADGTYVVSEMGWNYQAGNYNIRTVSPGTFGQFIY